MISQGDADQAVSRMKDYRVRPMRPGEERGILALVVRVFHQYVALSYSSEGIEKFLRYADERLRFCVESWEQHVRGIRLVPMVRRLDAEKGN